MSQKQQEMEGYIEYFQASTLQYRTAAVVFFRPSGDFLLLISLVGSNGKDFLLPPCDRDLPWWPIKGPSYCTSR